MKIRMRKFRRAVLIIGILMLLGAGTVFLRNRTYAVCRNCNVIVIIADSLPAARVSHLGYTRETTPRLDALAKHGISFSNAYTTSLDFPSSFLSILSGRYPSDQMVSGVQGGDIPTLASGLQSRGYKRAGFIAGLSTQIVPALTPSFDLLNDTGPTGTLEAGLTQALEWIRKNKEHPFFIVVSGNDLGDDAPIPEEYTGRFFPLRDFPLKLQATREAYRGLQRDLQLGKTVTSEYQTFWLSYLDSILHDADRAFGTFLDSYNALGLSEKTIIIVVSDYGTEVMEHGQLGNSNVLFEERVRVPFVISTPGIPSGRILNQQVSTADITPTVFGLLGIRQTRIEKSQGVSLAPLLSGGTMPERDVYIESRPVGKPHRFGVRTPDGWKFIYTSDLGERALYNLTSDPKELQNLNPDGSPQELMKRVFEYEWKIRKHLDAVGADPYNL